MNKKKPRDQFIYIGSDKPFNYLRQSEDSFILPDDGVYWIFHQREYQRQIKPKIIYSLFNFFGSRSISLDPLVELAKDDRIYAIDTNYNRVAVTTVVSAEIFLRYNRLSIKHIMTRHFYPQSDKPEREAWAIFIDRFKHDRSRMYCLIVDSELGSLIPINQRDVPVLEDFYLPPNWQLNYATSDSADDFIAVRMMRSCDKQNAEFLRQFSRQHFQHNARRSSYSGPR